MTIQITYGTVTAAAQDISQASDKIKSQLDNLDARVKKVVATWSGEAQQAFNVKHAGWSSDVNGLTHTLKEIAARLEDATHGYKSTDKKAAQQFDF